MTPKQQLVWTALPNGRYNSDYLNLTVFLTPQLSSGGGVAGLDQFPDFKHWATWISAAPGGPIRFEVQWQTLTSPQVNTTVVSANLLDPARWEAVFNSLDSTSPPQSATYVKDYAFVDYSTYPTKSFDVGAAKKAIQQIYTTVGVNNATLPPVMTDPGSGTLTLPAGAVKTAIEGVLGSTSPRSTSPITKAVGYYDRPPYPNPAPPFETTLQILDFHEAVSALGGYPILLRHFGLAFDLRVPNPVGFASPPTQLRVLPVWTSHNSIPSANVSPWTACTVNGAVFRATPLPGSSDYANGMLNLADASRFGVTDLDVDGGAQQLTVYANGLESQLVFEGLYGSTAPGQSVAVPLPTIRQQGPAVYWTQFSKQLTALAKRQTAIWQAVQTNVPSKLPVFYAQDLIRGHRFDVYTVSDPSPAWRSLHQRQGTYSFGPGAGGLTPSATNLPLGPGYSAESTIDEGFVTPGATTDPNDTSNPPALYVHEEIARWSGWSMSVSRPGNALTPDDSTSEARGNPAVSEMDGNGNANPQMAAEFTVIGGSLPKLRFGEQYQFRARGVDLAGNSLPPSSTDALTATLPFTHYRYQPVTPPITAGTAPFSPGQSSLVVAILNWCPDNNPNLVMPDPLGRWLFPSKVAELLAEQHQMFDRLSMSNPVDSSKPPDGSVGTWDVITQLNDGHLHDLGVGQIDPVAQGWYFDPGANPRLTTPWLPDPLSAGISFSGLPGASITLDQWDGTSWPVLGPELFTLQGAAQGVAASTSLTPGSSSASPVRTLTLPPAAVMDIRIASWINDVTTLGIFQWMSAGQSGLALELMISEALAGQYWMLTPYETMRVAHVTRVPLTPFTFSALSVVTRPYGSTTANLYDLKFIVDAASTASVDVDAIWSDPVDDPSDILNDPATDEITTTATAFKFSVPDPNPPLATDNPGLLTPGPDEFAFINKPGLTHDIGDTKHHYVTYTPTGTSRFAEFFRPQRPIVPTLFPDTTPVQLSEFGINVPSVEITDPDNDNAIVDPSNYTVDPKDGTVALTAGSSFIGKSLTVDFEPTVTLDGGAASIHVLASARPAMPKIDRVMPAWQIAPGTTYGGQTYTRTGNWLRIWLDRPWWSSGANEMLGVVTLPKTQEDYGPPAQPGLNLATLIGLDPISVADPSLHVSTTPQMLGGTAALPPMPIPGRPNYANPPSIKLDEDPTTAYAIHPYAVTYDEGSGKWYADVHIGWPTGKAPPPGYMVRLGLVRFQPYAYVGAEVSRVALASYVQPVPDRAVTVINSGPQTVRVVVGGPGYQGFRPANPPGENGTTVYDEQNEFAIQSFSYDGGQPVTSTMVVDVQTQDSSQGLSGELSWAAATNPVALDPVFEGPMVYWTGTVTLPYAIGGSNPMRLRVSELDYYTGTGAPSQVDTSFRRPFVAHITLS